MNGRTKIDDIAFERELHRSSLNLADAEGRYKTVKSILVINSLKKVPYKQIF